MATTFRRDHSSLLIFFCRCRRCCCCIDWVCVLVFRVSRSLLVPWSPSFVPRHRRRWAYILYTWKKKRKKITIYTAIWTNKWTNGLHCFVCLTVVLFFYFALLAPVCCFLLWMHINISCFIRFCWSCKVGELWNDIWVCKSALNICIRCGQTTTKKTTKHFCRQFQYSAER